VDSEHERLRRPAFDGDMNNAPKGVLHIYLSLRPCDGRDGLAYAFSQGTLGAAIVATLAALTIDSEILPHLRR
jgi:hypothetical protein